MAKLKDNGVITVTVNLELTESEARALEYLCLYNNHDIAEALSSSISNKFTNEHLDGLTSFLDSCRKALPNILERTNLARRTFIEEIRRDR